MWQIRNPMGKSIEIYTFQYVKTLELFTYLRTSFIKYDLYIKNVSKFLEIWNWRSDEKFSIVKSLTCRINNVLKSFHKNQWSKLKFDSNFFARKVKYYKHQIVFWRSSTKAKIYCLTFSMFYLVSWNIFFGCWGICDWYES